MTVKVPCTECGAIILPATAKSTGGLCMPCKQGIRQDLERAKAFRARMKEYDPYRELWTALVNRREADPQCDDFSEAEKVYFFASLGESEIYNGGFDQFFWNSSGNHYALCLAGFRALDAKESARLLEAAALAVFGAHGPPQGQEKRWWMMRESGEENYSEALESFDREFWADPDDLGAKLRTYAEATGLIQPFLR